ncbi:MAG: hypothetical protein K9L22_05415 [Methylococcaceae bacterium]|nr:hypothetical protein [Methylococcaceae bacterium]
MKKLKTTASIGLLTIFITGCSSQTLKIPSVTSTNYEILGEAQAQATGIMLFNIIPIKQNDRFIRAYDAAVLSKNADALIDVEISERWFWAYILNGYKTTIKGTAIKYIKAPNNLIKIK